MADLHNPLFEDEKEFLERQKLEYERALLGDVDQIKEKTQAVGKYVAAGAGLAGAIWLITKAFSNKKSRRKDNSHDEDGYEWEEKRFELGQRHNARPNNGFTQQPWGRDQRGRSARRPRHAHSEVDPAVADDLGFGAGHHQYDRGPQGARHERAQLAPDVYHTDTTSFGPQRQDSSRTALVPYRGNGPAFQGGYDGQDTSPAVHLASSALQSFLHSEAGKVLIAQVSAVLVALVAKKAGEYFPMLKNHDLAAAPVTHVEPETKDIEFSSHDDANAPHQSL